MRLRARRKRGTVWGREFADAYVSGSLKARLDRGEFERLVDLHRKTPSVCRYSFRRSTLAALRRKARTLLAENQHATVGALAKLWLMLRHGHRPTGHEIFELVAPWQG